VARASGQPFQEVSGQQRNVLAPVAQRRDLQTQDIEPEVKVPAEGSLGHGLLQVAIGGGQNSYVDRDTLGATYGTNLPLLDGTQQLGLKIDGKLSHFIEEDRPALGDREQAVA